jgi:hypothetical protein
VDGYGCVSGICSVITSIAQSQAGQKALLTKPDLLFQRLPDDKRAIVAVNNTSSTTWLARGSGMLEEPIGIMRIASNQRFLSIPFHKMYLVNT